ncbi:MAG: PTS cellobiose transporter subunit IIC [Aerococcus sp.]|nr:PTS cellobiose transporter subunit IIC [Aerococcus sp.]
MENNNKFVVWMDKAIMQPLAKFSQFKFVRAIANTGMAVIPFTIVGSMFLVLSVIPTVVPALQGVYDATLGRIENLYMIANTATMGILSLYFNISLGFEFTKIYHEEEKLDMSPLNGALLGLMAYFMCIPQLFINDGKLELLNTMTDDMKVVDGWQMSGGVVRLSTSGIFTAIIMAVLAVMLYRLCVKNKWTIKLPDSVPEGVANSFTALIPAFVIAFVVLILNGLLSLIGYDVFTIVAVPFGFVTNLTSSFIGILVIEFLIQALWFVGVHGATIITSIIQPITLANLATNAAHKTVIPWAGEFNNSFVTIGGSGATLLLSFWMANRARSEQLSAIGKAEAVPALFNINEPLIFGLPFLYNVDLMIPWFLAPMASSAIGYWAIKLGVVRPVVAQIAWPTPIGLGGLISTGGDWKGFILAIVCAVVAFLIYYPFIRKYDKKLVAQEQAMAEE